MTKEEFETEYAARSRTTVDSLRRMGREALPCDCGEPECLGWQMGFRNDPAHFPELHAEACRVAGACVANCQPYD